VNFIVSVALEFAAEDFFFAAKFVSPERISSAFACGRLTPAIHVFQFDQPLGRQLGSAQHQLSEEFQFSHSNLHCFHPSTEGKQWHEKVRNDPTVIDARIHASGAD